LFLIIHITRKILVEIKTWSIAAAKFLHRVLVFRVCPLI
jgi:hypothetical protein